MPQKATLSKVAIAPKIEREADAALRVFVEPAGRVINPDIQGDRCPPKWANVVRIIIARRLDEWDTDDEQPATLDSADACIENAEFIAEHLTDNRDIGGARLLEIDHNVLISEAWLKVGIFYSEINCTYS